MSNEYNRPFYEIVCSLNHYKLGTIIESETGQRYKLTKTDNEYRKFSRIGKGLRFLTYENMNKKFRIVEEQEEIDIQELKEYEFPGYVDIKLSPIEKKLLELINQNRQAVQQIDNKLKEDKK